MFFDYYVIEETGEIITKKQFEKIARNYINSHEWEDGGKPTISEVMENMDDIHRYEEV